MPDRNVAFIRDLICHEYAKIIAKSAFAAFDGVQGLYSFFSLKHRGEKKFHDSIPPLLVCHRMTGHHHDGGGGLTPTVYLREGTAVWHGSRKKLSLIYGRPLGRFPRIFFFYGLIALITGLVVLVLGIETKRKVLEKFRPKTNSAVCHV
ncbi:MAG: hypothetical protein ABSH25_16670 [Syntrophorhabdales bacterium]